MEPREGEYKLNYVNPSKTAIEDYNRGTDDKSPIVIFNLLKLKKVVEVNGEKVSGKEAYKKYALPATKIAWRCGGQVLWMGKVNFTLIGPEDEKWDQGIMLSFPSRAHFLRMQNAPDYALLKSHREAAIETSRLLELRPVRLSKFFLRFMAFLYRAKTRST